MARENHTKSLTKVVQKVAEPVSDTEALAVAQQEIEAIRAETGYMARAMVLATLPHRKLPDDVIVYERQNGDYTLSLLANPKYGLPFGTIPRMLMSWVTIEVVRTQSPTLLLGDTLSDFMAKLGYTSTWGKRGMVKQLKEQAKRLFSTGISCTYYNPQRGRTIHQAYIAKDYSEWWLPYNPNQRTLWESSVVLSSDFFEEIITRPVPISLEALANLHKSPMALDIYFWLTHRNFGHPSIGHIGINSLQQQFGSNYPFTPQGKRDFKKWFLQALKKVSGTYSEAEKLRFENDILVVAPGRPDVTHSLTHKGVKTPNVQQSQQLIATTTMESPTPVSIAAPVSSFVPVASVVHKILSRPAEETPAEKAERCWQMQESITASKAKGISTFIKPIECGTLQYCSACQHKNSDHS
jgi:hypothetical protein